ncbi:MAG TPA: SLC13 family permease [Xanthobacteraceae bacterium]|nr:SLC13 family permease [Xanthobacteraceae bacterium]
MTNEPEIFAQLPPTGDHLAYARLLRGVDLFIGLDRVMLAKLAAHLQPLFYAARSIIFRQGDVGDAFYLVASGSVGVYATDSTGTTEMQVKVLHAGEPFGEMALLNNIPRTATIKVESDCEVLRLDRSAFVMLVREQPGVALAIAATLSRRLAAMLDQPGGKDADAHAGATRPHTGQIKVAEATPTAVMRPRWQPGRAGVALAAAVIIFGLGWLLPPPRGLTLIAWHGLVVLLAILPPLVLDALIEGVLALLLACAWVLFGVTSATDALSGFANTSWVLVVSILIFAAAITQTGVLYRLALATITHMRGGFIGEATALACAGQLLGPAVPNATSRIAIIAPLLRELIDGLGYPPKSRGAAGLAMTVLIGFGQLAATTLTSATTTVLVAAVLPTQVRGDINWITWTIYGAPFNFILFVGLLGTILWRYRPPASDRQPSSERAKSLALQWALLGAMSRDEKIALGVGIGLLAGFITQPLHHVDPGWVAAIAVGVLAATRVVTINTLRAVNWNFALLFGILISLATVFSHTGLDRWVTDRVAGAMGNLSSSRVAFVVVLALLCFAVSFVVRWQAAAPLVTIALAPVASAAGIHPYIVGLIAVIACNGFFLPYQSTTYLALDAGTGPALFTHAQALPTAIAFAGWTVVAAALSVPAWRLMGLM